MDIRNRMADVKKLRTNACQKYLSYVLVDNWQEELYRIIEEEIKKYPNIYTHARLKMRKKGIKNFTPYDMDITLINAIVVYHHDDLLKSIKQETINAFLTIKNDKNETSHADDNEDALELYRQSFIFLSNLRTFIHTIDKYECESISDNDRQSFLQKYDTEIEDMQTKIDNERIDSIQQKTEIDNDIQLILGSKNPIQTWLNAFEKYSKDMFLSKDPNKYNAFVCEAAKAGIVQAYALAADYYYSITKDYDMAEKYLRYLFVNRKSKRYDDPYLLFLANIYLNRLSTHLGDDKAIIEMLIADGHNIKKSEDGKEYIFVHKEDRENTPIKKAITSTEEALRILKKSESNSSRTKTKNSSLTVGGVTDSKKMRLGRVHKKKTDSSLPSEQS